MGRCQSESMFSNQNVLAFIVAGRAFSVAEEIAMVQSCDYVDVTIVASSTITEVIRAEANLHDAVSFEHHPILTGDPAYEILTSYFVDETVFLSDDANPWLVVIEAPQPNLTAEILTEALDRLFLAPDVESLVCDEQGSAFAVVSYHAFMREGRVALDGAMHFQTV